MTRTQFLGLFAIPFLPKINLEQEGHVFNVKKIKERLNFLRKYPLTEKECFRIQKEEPWMREYQKGIEKDVKRFNENVFENTNILKKTWGQ